MHKKMTYLFVGLGNPGEEYLNTRHNTGRMVVEAFRKKHNFPDWQKNENAQALFSEEKIGKNMVKLILPETFMNKSGKSLSYIVNKNKIKSQNIIVFYDDLDLPLDKLKLSFNRGSGGHKGLESVERSIKTKEFIRMRIGISPVTAGGKLKKPQSGKKVLDFILGEFKEPEKEKLKKIISRVLEASEEILEKGLGKVMGEYN
jgi:PTH1 family peptidyl-tRNA hydrolase